MNVFRAPPAVLNLWPGIGTRGVGLAAASTEAAFNSSVPQFCLQSSLSSCLPLCTSKYSKILPLSGLSGSLNPFWTLPELTALGSLVWFAFREVTAVVVQFFPVVGSRYFWVGFSLK